MAGASNISEQARKGAGRPSAEEAERKHAALIEAALEEFASRGFRGASLRTIAAKADISTRTLYNHYPDKVALFAVCLETSSVELRRFTLQTTAPAASAAGTDLAETLAAHVVAVLEQLSQERSRQIAVLLYREGAEFAEVREIARAQFERYQVDPVVDILQRHGMTGAGLRDEATQFVAMAFGEWQRRLLFGGQPMIRAEMEQQARLVVRLFLCGAGNGKRQTD
jgi:AcrR family transcriptional regulator